MKHYFFLILILGFLFRVSLINVAHHGDLNNNISWGEEFLNRGVVDFYGSPDADDWPYSAPNQPPLYILTYATSVYLHDIIDSGSRALNNKFSFFPSTFIWYWETNGTRTMAKIPSILADVAIAFIIYKYVSKKEEKQALILGTVWLFNPISWYNSAVWGQTDAIVNLFGLIAILSLLGKYLIKSCFWYAISFVFKSSLITFAPIMLVYAYLQKYVISSWIKGIIVCLVVIFVTSFWFHPSIDFPLWFIYLFKDRILPGEIGYLSANAFNLWWLVDSGKTLDTTMYFNLSARHWGIVFMVFTYGYVVYKTIKGKIVDKNLLLSLMFVSFATFMFMTRMHERYLFPFFPLATIGLFYFRWLIVPYVVLSLTYLLNMYHLFYAPSIPFIEVFYNSPSFSDSLAIINLLVFAYFVFRYHKSYQTT